MGESIAERGLLRHALIANPVRSSGARTQRFTFLFTPPELLQGFAKETRLQILLSWKLSRQKGFGFTKSFSVTLHHTKGEKGDGETERWREGEGERSLSDDSIYPFKIITR